MRIALSGLNNSDNPASGVGVAKALVGHDLVGFAYEATEPGIYQGTFERVYLMPFPSLGFEPLRQRLEEITAKTPIDLAIPNLDAELPLYIKYQSELARLGIATYLPTMEQFESRDKTKLATLAEKLGIKHPRTVEVNSVEELVREAPKIGFPLMVKGKYYKARKVGNLEEAIDAFYRISNEWGFPILLQEVVSGSEINMVALSDAERVVGGVCIKKLMTTELGKVWSAITIKNDALVDLARRFVETTGFRGPFELECIAGGDGLYLIEINPRFPAWIHFATMVGVNLPAMLVELAEGGRPEPAFEYPGEKMYVRYVEELLSDYHLFLRLLHDKELGE
jgi:carbamoyl-phosphate synthase large subunit